jgi:hypothetical protein
MVEQRGWDKEYFERQASAVGKATAQVVHRILESTVFYEQTYNSCLGILRLSKQYGHERLEAACSRALTSATVNYGMIANILKNNLDRLTADDIPLFIPKHGQIRGPEAYQ